MKTSIIAWGHKADKCLRPECSRAEWDRIIVLCGNRCFYCAEILLPAETVPDHLFPLSRRGCRCCENVVPSCPMCNSMKKERTVYEFLADRPAFVQNTGKFFTSIYALRAHPLSSTLRRLAEKKAMA